MSDMLRLRIRRFEIRSLFRRSALPLSIPCTATCHSFRSHSSQPLPNMAEHREDNVPYIPSKRPPDNNSDAPMSYPGGSKRVRLDAEPKKDSNAPSPASGDREATLDCDVASATVEQDPKHKKKWRRDAASSSEKTHTGKVKGKKRDGKGTGRRGSRQDAENSGEAADNSPRLPKRQCALLIGFCGTGCAGMQMYVSIGPY